MLTHWDLSGVWTSSHKARNLYGRLNHHSRGFPDLVIYKPAYQPGTERLYSGLALELKVEGTRLRKRNGSWATLHIAEQADVLERLRDNGFVALFACGFDEAIECIESYFAGQPVCADAADAAPAEVVDDGEVF